MTIFTVLFTNANNETTAIILINEDGSIERHANDGWAGYEVAHILQDGEFVKPGASNAPDEVLEAIYDLIDEEDHE